VMKELDLEDIQKMHEAAKNYNSDHRQDVQDDLYFYWISHYNDDWRQALPLRFQGQFDQLRKSGRKIIGDLTSNPVQADFQPIDGTPDEMAEFADKMYRTDARRNDSKEAFNNAINEQVPCGLGGWRIVTDYETDLVGDTKQVIRRIPQYEFNATVLFDPAAKRIDKSDAKWAQVITAYDEEGYEELKEDLSGNEEECESLPSGFNPVTSNAGLWADDNKNVYVVEHYHRYKKKVTIVYFKDLFGEPTAFYEEQVKENAEALKAAGYIEVDRKKITKWCVKKYICSGEGILDSQDIAGTEIPLVPLYGERAFVDGREHYEGFVRSAKDPQMLRNFQLSYLADIVSTSPRPKPIFLQEQIAGHEYMYEENGADNNFAYYLQNRVDSSGTPLPIGPIAVMPEQPIPSALIASIQLMSEATGDVTQSGAPNSIADVSLSGNAVSQIRSMLDEQSIVYRENYKFAIRRDAQIVSGMWPDVYDIPRKVTLTSSDGKREEAMVMQSSIDLETGEHKVMNDLRTAKFEVFAEIGTAYESQKQQQRQEIKELLNSMDPNNPMYNALLLKYVSISDGADDKDIKAYAKKQLLLSGIREPDTDEEKQILSDAQQQSQQPDANMVLAQAEMEKAKQDGIKNEIDMFKAQTERFNSEIKAQEVGANIDFKQVQKLGQQIDNMQKLRNPPKSNHEPVDMRA